MRCIFTQEITELRVKKISQEVVSDEKRIENLEMKLKWLAKRMQNLEIQCYMKAYHEVSSEEDVSNELIDLENDEDVSSEEDEAAQKTVRPSTSTVAALELPEDKGSKRSRALKGQAASTSTAKAFSKISRASISTAASAPKRPRGRPPSS